MRIRLMNNKVPAREDPDEVPEWTVEVTPDSAEKLIKSLSDIAIVVDGSGVISDVVTNDVDLAREAGRLWRGRAWTEVVTPESRPKVEDLIGRALTGSPSQSREINHPTEGGVDLPIRYSAVALGRTGRIIGVGRDLRRLSALQRKLVETQDVLERDYGRYRAAETRYRVLFHVTTDPVLIVDATTLRITDANPAALQQLAPLGEKIVNRTVLSCFDYDGGQQLESALKAARRTGTAPNLKARLVNSGTDLTIRVSVFRQEQDVSFLLQLLPGEEGMSFNAGRDTRAVASLVEEFPIAFAVVDEAWKITEANQAFLEFVHLAAKEQIIGEPIGKWLGRPGVDLELLMARLRESQSVRSFPTILRGSFGGSEDVTVTASMTLVGQAPVYGLLLQRNMIQPAAAIREPSARTSVDNVTELVGRVSLKDMVRESADIIEKLCIKAALKRSDDNRASAAQMLGLSRQSFYAKMRRHGLGNLDGAEDGEDAGDGDEDV
jgi:transcriptional regulator PpsR